MSDCCVTSLVESLNGHKGRQILKPEAVPTIFKHSVTYKPKPREASERRRKVNERQEVSL